MGLLAVRSVLSGLGFRRGLIAESLGYFSTLLSRCSCRLIHNDYYLGQICSKLKVSEEVASPTIELRGQARDVRNVLGKVKCFGGTA